MQLKHTLHMTAVAYLPTAAGPIRFQPIPATYLYSQFHLGVLAYAAWRFA